MKFKYCLLLALCAYASCLFAGFAEKWNEAFGAAEQSQFTEGSFEVHFLSKYLAPGPDPKTVKPTDVTLKDLTPEKYERIKEEVVRSEKEFKEATKKVEKLKEEFDEESLEYAEQRLKTATIQHERAKATLKAADEFIKEQKERAAGKRRKKAPEKAVTHIADTKAYFNLSEVIDHASKSIASMDAVCDDRSAWAPGSAKVYIVTDLELFNKMKNKDPLVSPVGIISQEPKTRSFLVYASPVVSNQLDRAFAYAACERFLNDFMEVENPGGEVSDLVRVGYCGYASKLDAVVTPKKVLDPPVLEEGKLLLTSQMIDPGGIKDPEVCLYFLRQAKVMVLPMVQTGMDNFRHYLTLAKNGNSGMRTSFENIRLRKEWGAGFDGFMLTLPEKGFLPLTKLPGEQAPKAEKKEEAKEEPKD